MSLELSICVLHYNHWELTKDCLASIDAQEIPCSYEKVLVDNGSTDPSLFLTKNQFGESGFVPQGWRIVRYDDNRGQIIGQNRCFESAQGMWVLFVANDVRLLPNCIKALYTSAITCKTVGQFQPQIYRREHTAQENPVDQCGMEWCWPGYGMSRRHLKCMDTPIVPSTCYLMPKRTWEQIGAFDEVLSTSHEDVDMGLRLAHRHYLREVIPSALAIHLGNATLKHQPSHNRAAFHRDRVYVIKKHYHGIDRLLRLAAIHLLDSLPHP